MRTCSLELVACPNASARLGTLLSSRCVPPANDLYVNVEVPRLPK